MRKVMMDRLLKYFLVLMVILPIGMMFHDSVWVKAMGVIYIFGLWWIARKPSRDEG